MLHCYVAVQEMLESNVSERLSDDDNLERLGRKVSEMFNGNPHSHEDSSSREDEDCCRLEYTYSLRRKRYTYTHPQLEVCKIPGFRD